MWPFSKRKEDLSAGPKVSSVDADPFEEFVEVPPTEQQILAALAELEKHGATISLTYAQMNGYDERLTNPLRLDELIELFQSSPQFTQEGISFAVQARLETLQYAATSPPVAEMGLVNGNIQEYFDPALVSAHAVMRQVLDIGRGDVLEGLRLSGINYRDYLVELAKSKRDADLRKVVEIVHSKEDILRPLFLKAHASGRNKYGETDLTPLVGEIYEALEYFFPKEDREFFEIYPPVNSLLRVAMAWVEEGKSTSAPPSSPLEFEYWCAREIEKQGWAVAVSKATGDQGVDVVASRAGTVVAIQCKRYEAPVGNGAVQEAYAGMEHYRAQFAFVISTAGFTRSAVELSRSTGVVLLDAESIGDFSRRVVALTNFA